MAVKESVTVDEVVEILNSVLAADRVVAEMLVEARVPCNALIDHPTIQVLLEDGAPTKARVGLLGILNGVFGVDGEGHGPIHAVYARKGLDHFGRR